MQKKIIPMALATGIILSTGGQAFAASGSNIISSGEQYLGKPYYYGALVGDTNKFDCSSFVVTVFREFGINLPRTSREQANVGTPVAKENLQIGDLLFFDTDFDGVINHVGIYSGNGKMINSQYTYGVSYANVFSSSYWGPSFVKAVRVLTSESSKETAPSAPKPHQPSASSIHTVQSGDSLWSISKKYNISITTIKQLNSLSSDTIYPNQKLKISQTAPTSNEKTQPNREQNLSSNETTSPSSSSSTAVTYKVQAGDTLWNISKEFGTTIDNLQKLNNLTTYVIFPGQTLKVSEAQEKAENGKEPNQPSAPSSPANNNDASSSAGSYFVENGDSLWGIALDQGITVNTLMKANNLSSTVIYPGQHLVIPN
ncbi:LysM peptidoglycan-binding domain-containing protein [Bacillus taeanensis]|uniref:Autolysin n=1 Tax=Bacillus taeanensis TaxID=273032 RepID=A0A366XQI3_9BACI|nr:LysM peptidoglycan-binding domain-containing protein [Bacillus taeanensis]RBW67976.1 autolysin [Bacillus taeanensis]